MSLADTFLNDLDELGSEDEYETVEGKPTKPMVSVVAEKG